MSETAQNPRTLLCFGDSNTHGTCPMASTDDQRRFSRRERWTGILQSELGEGWTVIEEGHPGRTTVHDDPIEGEHRNGLRLLPALLESHRPIDLVILMLGTNDLKARFAAEARDIALAIERLVRLVKASESGPGRKPPEVLLAAPAPIKEISFLGEVFAGGARKSRELGRRFADAADSLRVDFLDVGEVASVDELDGVHYAAPEHAKIGMALAERVVKMLG